MENAPVFNTGASCNPRKDIMLNQELSAPTETPQDRENRVQALLGQLRPHADAALRQMAERLADLPEDKSFGQIEYDLRDLAHEIASSAHQTGLKVGKKRGT